MRNLIWLVVLLFSVAADAVAYDPLVALGDPAPEPRDLDVVDNKRDRTIPIRVFLPTRAPEPDGCPVVLFSHGLGGSRRGCGYLGSHWAARGYVTVVLQHPGSDESVW